AVRAAVSLPAPASPPVRYALSLHDALPILDLAARVAPGGDVVGVDISPAMVAAATRRAAAADVTNVRFVAADAQTETLGGDFDAVYSRFGVMFFSDPVAAFANIGRSLRSRGRLACAVWAQLADNPWMFVPTLTA